MHSLINKISTVLVALHTLPLFSIRLMFCKRLDNKKITENLIIYIIILYIKCIL